MSAKGLEERCYDEATMYRTISRLLNGKLLHNMFRRLNREIVYMLTEDRDSTDDSSTAKPRPGPKP